MSAACWQTIEKADIDFAHESPKQQIISDSTHLRALVLLAALDADSRTVHASDLAEDRWTRFAPTMTKIAVRAAAYHPKQYNLIVDALRPISHHLNSVLEQTIGHPNYDKPFVFSVVTLTGFYSA